MQIASEPCKGKSAIFFDLKHLDTSGQAAREKKPAIGRDGDCPRPCTFDPGILDQRQYAGLFFDRKRGDRIIAVHDAIEIFPVGMERKPLLLIKLAFFKFIILGD